MGRASAVRRGAGLVLLVPLVLFASRAAAPVPDGASPRQDDSRTCLVCHDDAELESSAGTPVYVGAKGFAASVHGRAGAGCTGCHADLKGFEDFPHPPDLKPVVCAACHADYARTTSGGVHGMSSPLIARRPVLCKDCHGYHDVLRSSELRSPVHLSNRPATCAKCHPGAGGNYARGRVHEHPPTGGPTPAGVVRTLYKVLIAVLTILFAVFIAADLSRSRRRG